MAAVTVVEVMSIAVLLMVLGLVATLERGELDKLRTGSEFHEICQNAQYLLPNQPSDLVGKFDSFSPQSLGGLNFGS